MDYKVVFQETFLEDLENIVRKIAAENVSAAVKLGDRIVGQGESLVFFPERHPRVRQRPELRRYIVARHYKVFYRGESRSPYRRGTPLLGWTAGCQSADRMTCHPLTILGLLPSVS